MREKLLSAAENQTEIDLITLDQIWLGEFAEKGFLTNLTNYTKAGKGKTIGMKRAGMEALQGHDICNLGMDRYQGFAASRYADKAGVDPNS